MGHGCHTCGSPNSCECVPKTAEEKRRDHIMTVATVAASLPIDDELDARITRALNKRNADYKTRPLINLSEDDLDVMWWNLKALREDVDVYGHILGDEIDMHRRSIVLFEKILGRHKRDV